MKSLVFAWVVLAGFAAQAYGASEDVLAKSGSELSQSRGEQIVLLHGIARSSAHMTSMAQFLEEKGYTVYNLDYPSTKHRLEKLTSLVAADIAKKIDADRPVHFIGYSMGGLVVRAVLNKYRPDNLGLVILLATPNKGSEVADVLKNNWLFEQVYGPSGKQLETFSASRDVLLGKVDYTLGVVAGNYSIDPVSSMIIPGPDDGKVSVESTKIQGMNDHIVIGASHTFFPQNMQVKQQVLHFLRVKFFSR